MEQLELLESSDSYSVRSYEVSGAVHRISDGCYDAVLFPVSPGPTDEG